MKNRHRVSGRKSPHFCTRLSNPPDQSRTARVDLNRPNRFDIPDFDRREVRAYVPESVAAHVASITREVLERRFARLGGARANVKAAAQAATVELQRRVRQQRQSLREAVDWRRAGLLPVVGGVEANRRLLSRLAYERSGHQRMQAQVFDRVVNLLECIETGVGNRCLQLLLDPERHALWKDVLRNSEWLNPATPVQLSALRLLTEPTRGSRSTAGGGPDHRSENPRERMQHRTAAALLPNRKLGGASQKRIDKFVEDALSKGHHRKRVELALRRFFAPFCAHFRTQGLERGWHELSREERIKAVRYGLEIERIWLGDRPSAERVYQGFDQGVVRRVRRGRRRKKRPRGDHDNRERPK